MGGVGTGMKGANCAATSVGHSKMLATHRPAAAEVLAFILAPPRHDTDIAPFMQRLMREPPRSGQVIGFVTLRELNARISGGRFRRPSRSRRSALPSRGKASRIH